MVTKRPGVQKVPSSIPGRTCFSLLFFSFFSLSFTFSLLFSYCSFVLFLYIALFPFQLLAVLPKSFARSCDSRISSIVNDKQTTDELNMIEYFFITMEPFRQPIN